MHALLAFVGAWLILWGALLALLIARGRVGAARTLTLLDRIEVAL
ncbi:MULTISPECIES: hypothetical protein [unclassified Lysobacter]|nr:MULTISPECIES: hypothetical protein [unclassified Lysobacter]